MPGTVKGEEVRCKEAGMDDYISKPVIEETMMNVLSVWLLDSANLLSIRLEHSDQINTGHFNKGELIKYLGGDDELYSELITLAFETYHDLFNELKLQNNIFSMKKFHIFTMRI